MCDTSDASCSDCKMEIIQDKWTAILFKWLNKCVHPDKVCETLSPTCLADIMNKYKTDICDDDIDRAILCTDDIEPFIKYKYPILRLRYLSEDSDYKKKQIIMTSVLLFHCCIKSHSGIVHEDIWKYMNKYEQEVILKYCERLDDMEITINNVDCAIKEAFDYVKYIQNISNDDMEPSVSDTHANIASETEKTPVVASSSDAPSDNNIQEDKQPTLTFNSSVTVLPSAITDTSTLSSLETEEEESTSSCDQYFNYTESDEMRLYRSSELDEEKNPRKPYHRDTPQGSTVYIRSSQEKFQKKERNEVMKSFTPKRMYDVETDPTYVKNEGISTEEPSEFIRPRLDGLGKTEAIARKRQESLSKKREEILAKKRGDGIQRKRREELEMIADDKKHEFAPTRHETLIEVKRSIEDQRVHRDTEALPKNEVTAIRRDFGRDEKARVLDELGRIKHQLPESDSWYSKNPKKLLDDVNEIKSAETRHEVKQVNSAEAPVGFHDSGACSCTHCVSSSKRVGDKTQCGTKPNNRSCGDTACAAAKQRVKQERQKQKTKQIKPKKDKTKNEKQKKVCSVRKFLKMPKSMFVIQEKAMNAWKTKRYHILIALGVFLLLMLIIILVSVIPSSGEKKSETMINHPKRYVRFVSTQTPYQQRHTWICKKYICQIVYIENDTNIDTTKYSSLSRCSLLCMGPQLWPYPIGYTHFSKKLVALATNKLEYKFQSLPSEAVHQYLAEAFKLFIGDLARLEKITDDDTPRNYTEDLTVKKIFIQIDVEIDPDPRLKINTEESYHLKIDTVNNRIEVKIASASFCGVRHGLQTLSQMILLDQASGKLITVSNAVIKDAPTYRYRGLMIDTARNYIPVGDLLRTIDAMATVKLNTFHWRISDVTSFPLYLPNIPMLFEYGGYTRSMVYTKEDIKFLVERAGIRGVRVLIEIAAPGPVGRAWTWHPNAKCPSSDPENYTCENVLCLRLELRDNIMSLLQTIYSEIIEMTSVNDIFHLSDGVFSLANCYSLIEDRNGFLNMALSQLKAANRGILPKLPIIWQTPHLRVDLEARTWEKFGVQLTEMPNDPADTMLSKFKVIHSIKWDLSCEIKKLRCTRYRTWQEMYGWKSWKNIEVFTIEGGEAVLWTDVVNSGNLDSHLWPRAAAVAERLWSDTAANTTASGPVYVRLDSQRWRMVLNGVKVQPVWPLWCSFNPAKCMERVR